MVVPHGGLHVAVAVAEVADHAWAALERHHDHSAAVVAREQECVAAEGALAQTRLENERLKATIEKYQKALETLQVRDGKEEVLDTKQVSVGPSGSSSKSVVAAEGGKAFYDALKRKLESPLFLEKLGGSLTPTHAAGQTDSLDQKAVGKSEGDAGSWFMITENDFSKIEVREERDELGSDGYVVVSQEDIVEAIACFMAKYISTVPQAKKMAPKELQEAISAAFTDLEKKGKLRKLWDYGKFMYTAASWGATAVGIYRNPFVVRAALMAVWTSCCIILQLLK